VLPHAVVRCRVPEDVAQALAIAREEGLHVALRSGGHCFAGRSSTTAIAASLLVRAPADSDLLPTVTVFGAVLDQESAARAALDEFVAGVGAAPTKADYAPGPYREIKRYPAEYDICSASGGRSSASPATRTPSQSSSGASSLPT
jgi:hypothetical protein